MSSAAPDRQTPLARALSLHQAGRREEAMQACRALLDTEPDNAEAWHLLGVALKESGRDDEAAAAIGEATRLMPHEPLYRFNEGTIALGRGDIDRAIASFEAALALRPHFAEAATNLGLALAQASRTKEAEAAHRRATELDPKSSIAHYNLGRARHQAGDFASAISFYRNALALKPDHVAAQHNLATALRESGDIDAADAAYRRAIALAPQSVDGWLGLGLVQKDRGDLDAATASFREALRRSPQSADAHLNLGLALLSRGRFAEGWPHYRQRWNAMPLRRHRRTFTAPEWDGSDLADRRLLVHAEQGLGDTIQFAHLLPQIGVDRAQLVLEMPALLMPLLQPFDRYATLVAAGTPHPTVDLHCPLLDLPLHLGLTVETIRPMTGILAADPVRTERWRKALAPLCEGRRLVALCWRGGSDNPENERRSIDPALLTPLFEHDGFRFVSLQKDAPTPHPAVLDPVRIADDVGFDPKGAAFLDSAAIMQIADAVVTVDTALAHVAGALGRTTFLLLPQVADWRWLMARDDTPFYPATRLYRQTAPNDWQSAVARLATDLVRR